MKMMMMMTKMMTTTRKAYLTLVSGSHSATILICCGPQPVPQDASALQNMTKQKRERDLQHGKNSKYHNPFD